MSKNLKLISIYHLIVSLLLVQFIQRVNGYIAKVDIPNNSNGYYLNEKVPIIFRKENNNIQCIENTEINILGQNNMIFNKNKIPLRCQSDVEGSIILPKELIVSEENINTYKLQWNYSNEITIESDTFKIIKTILPGSEVNNAIGTNDKINNNTGNNNNNNNNSSNNNDTKSSTTKDETESKNEVTNRDEKSLDSSQNIDKYGSSTDPTIQSYNSAANSYNNSTDIANGSNKSNNNNNNELSVINKIMFVIIICLIGGIMVISVKLIKTRNENNLRKLENRRIQNNRNNNEIKFPPLRMNPLESESFLNINNSSSYDIFDSSKFTSIYVPSEESLARIENSNATFPIESKKSDVNNFKSILSSPP